MQTNPVFLKVQLFQEDLAVLVFQRVLFVQTVQWDRVVQKRQRLQVVLVDQENLKYQVIQVTQEFQVYQSHPLHPVLQQNQQDQRNLYLQTRPGDLHRLANLERPAVLDFPVIPETRWNPVHPEGLRIQEVQLVRLVQRILFLRFLLWHLVTLNAKDKKTIKNIKKCQIKSEPCVQEYE